MSVVLNKNSIAFLKYTGFYFHASGEKINPAGRPWIDCSDFPVKSLVFIGGATLRLDALGGEENDLNAQRPIVAPDRMGDIGEWRPRRETTMLSTGTQLPQETLARVPGAVEIVSLTFKGQWRAANPFTHLRGFRESGGIDSEGKRK